MSSLQRAGSLAVLMVLVGCATTGAPPPSDAAAADREAYRRLRAQTLANGHEVARALANGQAESLTNRFSPAFAAAVPPASFVATAASLAPFAPPTAEGVPSIDGGAGVYVAELLLRNAPFLLRVAFAPDARIEGVVISPAETAALPLDAAAVTATRVPFDGQWLVVWGGDDAASNYHVVAPDQRHALDLVVWRGGASHRGAGRALPDFWAWGEPVRAPVGGKVVAAVDGHPDTPIGAKKVPGVGPAGNHVVLEAAPGAFVVLAHFRQGSVRVRPGDEVRAGDVVGACGNSGNSSEPHVHVHAQDRPTLFDGARGLRMSFARAVVDGQVTVDVSPRQGMFLGPG